MPDSTFDGIQNKSDIVLYRIGVFFDNEKSSCYVIACNVLDEMQHHPDFYLWLTDDSFAFDQGACNFLHRNRLTLSDLSGFTLKYKCALVRAGTGASVRIVAVTSAKQYADLIASNQIIRWLNDEWVSVKL